MHYLKSQSDNCFDVQKQFFVSFLYKIFKSSETMVIVAYTDLKFNLKNCII